MARRDPDAVPITVVAHPPERGGARAATPAQAGAGCCCCCCCCLHSLGALIGATVGGSWRARREPATQEEEDYADFPAAGGRAAGPSAVRVYWSSVLVLGSLTFLVGGVWAAADRGQLDAVPTGIIGAGFVLLMLLPGLLLLAGLVAALVLGLSRRPDRPDQLIQLGRITLGALIGTVAGILPMACLLVALVRR